MTDRRVLIILNPAADRGRAAGLAPRLEAACERAGWAATVRATTAGGDEVRLARQGAAEGWPLIVAAGGDGTVHGAANGMLEAGPNAVPLGHVPLGTGNDFAKALGIRPGPPEVTVPSVLQGRARRFDVGRVLGEHFINGLGIGFDAEALRQSAGIRRLRGFALYVAAVYKTGLRFRAPVLEVTAPDRVERGRMWMLEVAIGPWAGGGFRVAPDAVPDDGLFDCCLIRNIGLPTFFRYVPRVVRGTHVRLPPVSMWRADRVGVTVLEGAVALHLDGELREPAVSSFEVELLPGYLRVVCARSSTP